MTSYQFAITVGATPVQLSAAAIAANQVLGGALASGVYSASYLPAAKLNLQSKGGNAAIIFVGGPEVSSSKFIFELGIPSGANHPGDSEHLSSFVDLSNLDLSQFWVIGTASDVLIVNYFQS